MTSFLPTQKKKGIRNRRLKLKRLWRRQKQTHKTNQPAKISNKQRQNQNSLKEGKYHLHKQTFRPFTIVPSAEPLNHSFSVQMWTLKLYWLIDDCLIVLTEDCLIVLISSPPLPPTGLNENLPVHSILSNKSRNTKRTEVGKDWELTKIAQSISHNQGSTKSGEGLGDGCRGNLCSISHIEALT